MCASCTFSSVTKRGWDRHHLKTGHMCEDVRSAQSPVLSDDDVAMISEDDEVSFPLTHSNHVTIEQVEYADFEPMINTQDSGEEDNRPLADSSRNGSAESPAADSVGGWFPWKSKAHFLLTTLYHGSHRRYH